MKVSVIVPNYNHGAFLKQRIDSILNQSFQDFELIILDDCSTDNSVEIIRSYEDHPRVSFVEMNAVNSGSVFKQWEKGLALSSGEYIWIAESDDYAEPDLLSQLVPILDLNTRLGLVYADSWSESSEQSGHTKATLYSQLRNEMLDTNKWTSSYVNDGRAEIKECLLAYCTINNASAVLFRADQLRKIFPFESSFKYFGDWYCYLSICLNAHIAYVHEPLNHYRDHEANASKKLEREIVKVEEYFKIYNWALEKIKFLPRKFILERLKHTTAHALSSSWSMDRLKTYGRLFKLNPRLFFMMFEANARGLKGKFLKNQ